MKKVFIALMAIVIVFSTSTYGQTKKTKSTTKATTEHKTTVKPAAKAAGTKAEAVTNENKNDSQNVRNGYTCHGECPFKIGFRNFILRAFPLFVNIFSISHQTSNMKSQ